MSDYTTVEDKELYRTLVDVANREIPTFVAYADIHKRLAAARAEGAELKRLKIQKVAEFTTADNPILNGPLVSASYEGHPARARERSIAIIPASVLSPEVKK